ncbi:Dynein heavy chain 7, axonemal [Hondaea fermentalgiana]|uniref:alpha-1,2-Mannosidase n=1 Tax=Hondaea fermentalgiana TaxID=2315210 RepID=A0A2R5GF02_9STRA|nr:Dynein heavy chain 7, axonemal [Hondaea fermentalgiana]|eukprot:GBG26414.1 Dynein heavy chain 7, axonemal [Hondaea fermentalgiana]
MASSSSVPWTMAADCANDLIAPSLQAPFSRRGSFRSNSLDFSANAADGDDDAVGEAAPVTEPHLDAEAEALARSRQTAVRDAFLHAWRGYKTYAWGKDSLHPKTKRGSDDFLGMAISILDSMDTALIMNLDDVFEEQYAWVVQELKFGHQEDINVFETTIRVVGGLLSAYALSGRTALLDLADDLGQRLLPAFDSKTGIPYGTLGLKTGKKYNPSWVSQASSVAEAGTLQMEFRYLAKLTGKREYRNKVDRVLHFFEKQMRTGSSSDVYDGLFPMYVHPETGRATGEPIITFGARGDSLYEYFLKSYLQSDRSEQWLLQMYETSMTGMTNHLLHQTSGPERYTYLAELNMKKPYDPIKKMDHLVCFVPGMLALGSVRGAGSKVAHDRARSHLAIAERLMRTCYSMYSTTATGLAPEIAHMDQPSSPELMPKNGAKHSLLRPETVESLFILWRVTKKQRYRDWGWEIFRAIENHARVSSGGYSGIADVTQVPPKLNDKMDSFFLAETLKYLYLLYAPDDLVPLDKYVFSTEAHPLPNSKDGPTAKTRTAREQRVTMQALMNFANKVATGTLFDATPQSDEERRAAITKMFAAYKAKSFPGVRDADPKQVNEALSKEQDEGKPVLVDCRPKGEQVSSVPGSLREDELDRLLSEPADVNLNAKGSNCEIILYCTVGYRSGVKASKLQKEYPDRKFSNLSGGILLWAHDVGKVVSAEGKDTKTVHVFGKAWDLLPQGWTSVIGDPGKLQVLTGPELNVTTSDPMATEANAPAAQETGILEGEASEDAFRKVWNGMCNWMLAVCRERSSFIIPDVGVVQFRKYKLGAVVPSFIMASQYAEVNGLRIIAKLPREEESVNALRIDFRAVNWLNDDTYKDCVDTMRFVLRGVFRGFGELASKNPSQVFALDIGCGKLVAFDRQIRLQFSPGGGLPGSSAVLGKLHEPRPPSATENPGGVEARKVASPRAARISSQKRTIGRHDSVSCVWFPDGSCKDLALDSQSVVRLEKRQATVRRMSLGSADSFSGLNSEYTSSPSWRGSSKRLLTAQYASMSAQRSPRARTEETSLRFMRREKSLRRLAGDIRGEQAHPSLLNQHARTLAAVHVSQDESDRKLPDRIGTYYSPEARVLALERLASRSAAKASSRHQRQGTTDSSPTCDMFSGHRKAPTQDREDFLAAVTLDVRRAQALGQVDRDPLDMPNYSPRAVPERREPFDVDSIARDAHSAAQRRNLRRFGKGMTFVATESLQAQQAAVRATYLPAVDQATSPEVNSPQQAPFASRSGTSSRTFLGTEEDIAQQYVWYVRHGVDDKTLAPIRREWLQRVSDLLPAPRITHENASSLVQTFQTLVATLTKNVEYDYQCAVRRAILDYILRDAQQRSRLGIPYIPSSCQRRDPVHFHADAPRYWRETFQGTREHIRRYLTLVNPLIRQVLHLWQDYAHLSLVNLPSTDDEALRCSWKPPTLEVFVEAQVEHAQTVRDIFLHQWHPEVVRIFTEAAKGDAPPLDTLGVRLCEMSQNDLQSLFESAATLMARQLRGLVLDSLQRLLSFFLRLGRGGPDKASKPHPYKSELTATLRSAFYNKLVVTRVDSGADSTTQPRAVCLEVDLEKIVNGLSHVIDTISTCLNRVVRIERKGIGLNLEFLDEIDESMPLVNTTEDPSTGRNAGRGQPNGTNEGKGAEGGLATALAQQSTYVMDISPSEDSVSRFRQRIEDILIASNASCQTAIAMYVPFEPIFNAWDALNSKLRPSTRLQELQDELDALAQMQMRVCAETKETAVLGAQTIDCQDLNSQILAEIEAQRQHLLRFAVQDNIRRNLDVCKAFSESAERLAKVPADSHALIDAEEYLRGFQSKGLDALLADVADVKHRLDFIFRNQMQVEADLLRPLGITYSWVHKVDHLVEDAAAMLRREREQLEGQFQLDRDRFIQELSSISKSVAKLKDQGDMRHAKAQLRATEEARALVEGAKRRADLLHDEEDRLGLTSTEFKALTLVDEALKPFETFWSLANRFQTQFQRWNHGVVFTLDGEHVEREVGEMFRAAHQLAESLKDEAPAVASCADAIKAKLNEFRDDIPLLSIISNDGLRERHWTQISDLLGFPIVPDDNMTLSRLIELQVGEHVEALEAISEGASKEHAIENAHTKMMAEWAPLEYATQSYKDTGTFILQGGNLDELQTLLDDHLVKTQTMRGSPYCKFMEEKMAEWEHFLVYTRDLIDAWIKVQTAWLYLDPIFASEDIMRQMPNEGQTFQQVSKMWRDIMDLVHSAPKVTFIAKVDHLLEQFHEIDEMLEQINKGLSSYLETKRLYFSRFFFLSNDELLEILAETKDPTRVQPFLKKCFEGIKSLRFRSDDQGRPTISHMISSEGESVQLTQEIAPHEANGAVEVWLLQLEEEMCRTVKHFVREAIADYPTKSRGRWILDWAGQVVLAVGSAFWTQEVETELRGTSGGGLAAYESQLSDQLSSLVTLVRGELSKLERATLSALAVIDVHARDVVRLLAEASVSSVQDFDWTSQLRYYWENETLAVKIITSSLEYGYEYLGNSSRLVITPLTDRCYRTLMGALHLQYGGAPEGPAGTGKTETVKDLAKALARQCVVFNCSDGLDYLAMAKFFKGLASSGAWACFDEFNRIELEVLSVIAQQISSIQGAIARRAQVFEFEGTEINLRWTANVFITMNPGYAGRSELPDNLKALFRTVAMMVPDYAMIAEIILFSYGYADSRNLANKIVTTYKLCSEQLSSQDHYDYGMRAVISVLKAAGALKRQFPDEDESIIVLRSICDVNLAKFISQDLPLFKGIISDLFPGVVLPDPDYVHLTAAAEEACAAADLGIEPVPVFMEKVIQLYEMLVVRHGLMIVGGPLAGKTMSWKVLSRALTTLCERQQMPCKLADHELATDVFQINPKAVTMQQLYGCFDMVSHEWSDGVLAKTFRDACKATDNRRKWILFDGPVDAVWIENLNTVLDDNKKLCLMSGEIIAMSDYMNMVFEPIDLAVASPATVSRCGMVYMEPEKLGWRPMADAWLRRLREKVGDEGCETLREIFDWLVAPSLYFYRKNVTELAPTSDLMLVRSMTQLIDTLVYDVQTTPVPADCLEPLTVFALVWSVGGTANNAGRESFDAFFRSLTSGSSSGAGTGGAHGKESRALTQTLPKEGLVYDYFVQVDESRGVCDWKPWTSTLAQEPDFAKDAVYASIIVPTKDTARYTYLLRLAVQESRPLLFVGPTGTGKSAYTSQYLLNDLDPEAYQILMLGFSAQTSVTQVQGIIDASLDRRRKGVFGPSLGRKCVIFLDDVNMPQPETYGAQPPLELLRQGMKYGGWYDFKDLSFRHMVDCFYVAAMGPPGGGRNHVSPRFLRHFHMVGVTEFDEASMSRIFSSLMRWNMKCHGCSGIGILRAGQGAVDATMEVYRRSVQELLPTPSRSHYLFNLRDVSRVIQGMTQFVLSDASTPEDIARLWAHETLRVFGDRLVDGVDRDKLVGEMMSPAMKSHFGKDFAESFSHLADESTGMVSASGSFRESAANWTTARRVLFGSLKSSAYEQVVDLDDLRALCEAKLEEYNTISPKPMDLVMFLYAIEHTVRICRVIGTPGGNALLVGVGGSGRQSLTRLAASMRGYQVFQIELSRNYGVTDWHADLRRVLALAGGRGEDTVFLLSDAQIKEESFVEDINSLLNSGEVPNMLAADEKAELCELARAAAKQERRSVETPEALYAFVVERVRSRLHLVLAFSPIGEAFRARIRRFPSLVNCCVIDWFSEWPQDALTSVAERFLDDLDPGADEMLKATCVALCKKFHVSTAKYAKRFMQELRRPYYVTPTSYLELINAFKTMLSVKRSEVEQTLRRYEVGLEKLQFTEDSVQGMQKELQDLQPVLVRTTRQTEEMMAAVEKEQTEADKIATVVKSEEAIANEKAQSAKGIKEECEADLAKAMPVLESAIAALNTLSKSDITEVKSMKSPPDGVKLVMEALCIMMNVKPIKAKDPNDASKKINDYWEPAKKTLLSDPKLLKTLIDYDKDNIDPKVVQKATTYVENPDFDPEKIKKASRAAYGLCCWIRAMVQYDSVAKVVAPKRAALAEAEQEFELVMAGLREKQAELSKIESRVAGLARQLEECKERKRDLEQQVSDCTAKLDRAEKLISGLGGEKARWGEEAVRLRGLLGNLIGNVLVCSGMIAYLGPFTVTFRREITAAWITEAIAMHIPCSSAEEMNLVQTLGDKVKIRAWTIQGLPVDEYSIENGIMLSNSRRWPLMIDPQGQANKWVRNMEAEHELKVCKLSDANYLRTMENAVQFGHPVLLENIEESLPAALEPLLLKQVFKKGGVPSIRLGDATVEYSERFRFYMTTKLRNPHYLPEISVKVTLLNFMITPVGLEDQMLGIVVARERPDLEREKSQLIIETSKNQEMLRDIEDKILKVMSSSEGNILDDASAIEVLSKSQTVAKEISVKQEVANKTSAQIDAARQHYVPIARRAATMFFCCSDLAFVDPMYQYSLTWFVDLYEASIEKSEPQELVSRRLEVLETHFTDSLYRNICRSLFERDKLLFSFLLCMRLHADAVPPSLFRFLVSGPVRAGNEPPENPCAQWLPDTAWSAFDLLCEAMEDAGGDDALRSSLSGQDQAVWEAFYQSPQPEVKPALPTPWEEDGLLKLCVLRSLRPDRVVPAVRDYVAKTMGPRFVEPPRFDLEACWQDSRPHTPLVFVLSPGSDPMAALSKLADQRGVPLASLSLGQGQGVIAERMIDRGVVKGSWVVLQNCHLYPSWMPTLEQIVERLGHTYSKAGVGIGGGEAERPSEDFRLWLTSYPSEKMPVAILQSGVKMTNEPPKGLRSNLVRSYFTDPISDPEFFETCVSSRAREFKRLVFGLCFFHAVVQERRSFGPLGWNVPYGFNEDDLRISVRHLRMFVEGDEEDGSNSNDGLPFKALVYTIGACNYGGRVTDDQDRRLLDALLKAYMNPDLAETDNYAVSPCGLYKVPSPTSHAAYVEILRDLPAEAEPQVFGLHANADITRAQQETLELFRAVQATQPRSQADGGGDGASAEHVVEEMAESILEKLPARFDVEAARVRFPVLYEESMNTVLTQELVRYNVLTDAIRESLLDLIKATQGLVVMSAELENIFYALLDGIVPQLWMSRSYPSLRGLTGYIGDLVDRLAFFQRWVDEGTPTVFWISGIFFTQSFNTAILQNFARRHQLPIDTIDFSFVIDADASLASEKGDGALVNGMYLQGGIWDAETHAIAECRPKELYSVAPTIHLLPAVTMGSKSEEGDLSEEAKVSKYACPLYRTPDRRGVLATTGRSSNFVMMVDLPCAPGTSPHHWIIRSVALLLEPPR